MAVFRIERTKDYTVMSNHHLRNHELSLKAKGLLSMMLSLPDDWNYTMNVTFCGHSQITKADNIANWLRNVTQDLIEQGATTFYLGGYGEFDSLAASILREQKKKYPQIELVLVLAYLNTGRDVSGYDSTVYPPLENVPRRFSISHRNRWMVESADVVVAYVLHDWGGAATTLRCAKQKKKQIISYRDEMGS